MEINGISASDPLQTASESNALGKSSFLDLLVTWSSTTYKQRSSTSNCPTNSAAGNAPLPSSYRGRTGPEMAASSSTVGDSTVGVGETLSARTASVGRVRPWCHSPPLLQPAAWLRLSLGYYYR